MFWPPLNYCNGTTPTGWDDYLSPTATRYWYVTPVATWKEPPRPPKWWRWFDVFRTWPAPKLLQLLEGWRQAIRKVQERYPARQRAKQKRRAYVQALHAL